MKKMKYQAGGSVDSTDDISPEKLEFILQQQKDAEMDANMQKGLENHKKLRVGGQAAKDEAAAKKAAAKKAAAKKAAMAAKPKPVETENMNMGGMVGYKKGGKVGYKTGGKVRGCGIATQGVRKAQGSY